MTCACQTPILGLGWFGAICVACGHPAREERGATVGVLDWLPAAKENPGLRYEREWREAAEEADSEQNAEAAAERRNLGVEQARAQRHEQILELLAQRGALGSGQLAYALGKHHSTTLNDLTRLAQAGAVKTVGDRYILPRSPQGTGPRAIAPMTPGAGTGSGGGGR